MALIRLRSPQHPAVLAWRQVCPKGIEPNFVEVLQEVKKGDSRSCIYRLSGIGSHGKSVIAKRCTTRHAHIEQTIYQDILNHLPISRLIFYGSVDEPETGSSWLFLEDAEGFEFMHSIEEHRKLAARWLGEMHISAARVSAISRLPDRGPKYYLDHLRLTRQKIESNLSNLALPSQDCQVIDAILSQGHFLESRWDRIEEVCDRVPRTLVHGDFAKYNLRVRASSKGANLLAFDWEMAGYGIPAPDIAESSGRGVPRRRANSDLLDAELVGYWSVVRKFWSDLDLFAIKELAELGAVFRSLAAISWESESIRRGWWPIKELRGYHVDLTIALEQLHFVR